MRKRSIVPDHRTEPRDDKWLDLAKLAEVEVTSESDSHPIEFALLQNGPDGWRAAGPGQQTIRILFDEPQTVRRILLVFEEHELARSQEFVLRWSPDRGDPYRDIVRQQWNFSPPDTVREYVRLLSPRSGNHEARNHRDRKHGATTARRSRGDARGKRGSLSARPRHSPTPTWVSCGVGSARGG
jgi:hypothetical protein